MTQAFDGPGMHTAEWPKRSISVCTVTFASALLERPQLANEKSSRAMRNPLSKHTVPFPNSGFCTLLHWPEILAASADVWLAEVRVFALHDARTRLAMRMMRTFPRNNISQDYENLSQFVGLEVAPVALDRGFSVIWSKNNAWEITVWQEKSL